MLHPRFVIREILAAPTQAAMFSMCVVCAIISLVAINGFSISVNTALRKDARMLQGGDIIVQSRRPFSESMERAVEGLKRQNNIQSVRTYEFYSVVRSETSNRTLLSKLKAVGTGYPIYGQCELASGFKFEKVLKKGYVVVEPLVLERLQISVGDRLQIGRSTFVVADLLVREPDRPVNAFNLGPRIFISTDDLQDLGLIEKGSRVRYKLLINANENPSLASLTARLQSAADTTHETVDTYQTAPSGLKRFFDRFVFFLNLIGIFTLMLAGIGIHGTLTAYLREKKKTIAIIKTFGAANRFVVLNYLTVVWILGVGATVLGLLGGSLLQRYLKVLFGGLIPPDIEMVVSWQTLLEGLGLGVVVVGLFAFLPLMRLQEVRPTAIFRKESASLKNAAPIYGTVLTIFAVFSVMTLWQLKGVQSGLWFIAGAVGFILTTAGCIQLIWWLLRRLTIKKLMVRQALRGLYRPGNATRPIIIALAASMSVIFSIFLIEQNLNASYVKSYPVDAPNLFFLDIQADQRADFEQVLGIKTEYYPIVRAKIIAINGTKIDRRQERQRRGDNLARDFYLTYRTYLLEDEALSKGSRLFQNSAPEVQVSVLDTVAGIGKMNIGDTIDFNIQGIPISAKVSSIRTRTKETLKPFFYFVFDPKVLKDAPQTIFTAVKVEDYQIAAIQNRVIAQFPNITVIDMTQTILSFSKAARKMSAIIRFFTVISMFAGLLMVVSSIVATRFARIREAVYYKVLGARTRFVLFVFGLENGFIGLVSAMMALMVAQTTAWIVTHYVLHVPHAFQFGASVIMVTAAWLITMGLGLAASISILRQKPVAFLKDTTAG